MRIAIIGVSHWHAPLYYRPAARLAGVRIVGVSDQDLLLAETVGHEVEARAFADYRDLIADTRPDYVFAFGRHCDMAEIASTLIDAGIPFLVEKPGGLNYQQVAGIRDRAEAKGLHAGTGFNFRVSDLYKRFQAVIGEDPVTHASFRYIAGGPYRYRETGCAWMLDPKLSGGGCTINLSIHFVNMFLTFTREKAREVASLMGNFTWNLPIEDYSSMILRSRGSVCTIESGYTYPAQMGVLDVAFSIRTSRHYLIARQDDTLEVYRTCDGHLEKCSTPVTNSFWYPVFVTESIDRAARGKPPLASLTDLADAMEVIDAAYASNHANGAVVGLGER